MTQFQTLTVKDSLAADVNFNATVINYVNGVATWRTTGTNFDTSAAITFSMSLPTAKSTRTRIKEKVVIPVVNVLDATKKDDEIIVNIEFIIPKSATLLQRQNARAFASNLLAGAVTSNATDNLAGVY
jgi:hypothetical protein